MHKDIHPSYEPVVFRDRSSADTAFLSRSPRTSTEAIELDGATYAVIDVELSSASHPFWTGRARSAASEGRVERFDRQHGATS